MLVSASGWLFLYVRKLVVTTVVDLTWPLILDKLSAARFVLPRCNPFFLDRILLLLDSFFLITVELLGYLPTSCLFFLLRCRLSFLLWRCTFYSLLRRFSHYSIRCLISNLEMARLLLLQIMIIINIRVLLGWRLPTSHVSVGLGSAVHMGEGVLLSRLRWNTGLV